MLNGEPKIVGSAYGWIPYFAERKPDGHIVYNDKLAPLDDGRMLLTLTDQALASAGNAICCIVLRDDRTNEKLTSQNFILCIEYSPGAYENLASTDEIIGIDGKAEELQALIDSANETLADLDDINNELQTIKEKVNALPTVTASDNGKFLQVVDGAYALVALTDVSVEGA